MIIAKQSLGIMRPDIFASRIERSGSLSDVPLDPTTKPKTTCLTKVRSPRQTSDNGRALLEIFRRVRLQSLYDGLCCNSKPPPFNNRVRPPPGCQFTGALANVCLRNWRQAVVDPSRSYARLSRPSASPRFADVAISAPWGSDRTKPPVQGRKWSRSASRDRSRSDP